MMEQDGRGILYLPVTKYAAGNLDIVRDMAGTRTRAPTWV